MQERQKRLTTKARKRFRNEQIVAVCEICAKPFEQTQELCVDHDHRTGEARGILCRLCNSGIGFLRDNPTLVTKALTYLLHQVDKPLRERPHFYLMGSLWTVGKGKLRDPAHVWSLIKAGKFPYPRGYMMYVEVWDKELVKKAIAELPALTGETPLCDNAYVAKATAPTAISVALPC